MSSPDTITGPSSSDGVLPTARWDEAPHDPRFSVSPLAKELLSDLDSMAVANPTATGATTPLENADDSQFPSINGYRILGILGRGGMGTVYKALHLELKKIVALKILHPGGREDSTLRLRFEREFRSLASVEHANIVPVYDAGTWQGLSYFTMKYIPEGALSQHLKRFNADPAAGGRMMAKVARAMHHLHEVGVLHRDLKPLNILIGEDDEPLVADFGLAKWLDDDTDVTMTGLPMGTRQYMSPEQSLGKKSEYTPACDIWALGIILYEVVAGQRPFASDDPVELYTQIRSVDPPPMTQFNTDAPRPLEEIARRCLAKRPEDRYASAREVELDLERWLNGEATTATVAPRPRRRRRPTAYVIGAATATLGAFLLAFFPGWLATKKSIAERLFAGQTVELIKNGAALEPFAVLPGSLGTPNTEKDGYFTLNSISSLGVEFSREPLPGPARLEGEVALAFTGDRMSSAGPYVGRFEIGLPDANAYDRRTEITYREEVNPDGNNPGNVRESAGLEFLRTSLHGPGTRTEGTRLKRLVKQDEKLNWHAFTLTQGNDSIAATWDDQPLQPLAPETLNKLLQQDAREPGGIPFTPPIHGNGFGLCIYNCQAVFRNVRIVPLLP
ncbi:MAG TPA: serine/threonine-protein kinase [Urbifossiella sp.]